MTIKEAIFGPIATIVTPVFLALALTGCDRDYRYVCVRSSKVVKIHSATPQRTIIELQDGTITTTGMSVKLGDTICLKEKREPITATK